MNLLEEVTGWWGWLWSWIQTPLITIGDGSFSIASILKFVVFFAVVLWMGRIMRRALVRRVFPHAGIEKAMGEMVASLVFYLLVTVGVLIGLQVSGIDLSTLTVIFGAIGVGVGFGLQTIASNLISGIILLFEQPIRIGDRVQIGDLNGRVLRIRTRATEVVTNDGIAVIIPNSEFIAQRVINWSHGDENVRLHVPVGVAYGSDVSLVQKALLEAAGSVDEMLKDPGPKVWMTGFGDSSLNFELLGWTNVQLHNRGEFVSLVNLAIHESLRKHGIEIPFPQRDLHLKSAVPVEWTGAPAARG